MSKHALPCCSWPRAAWGHPKLAVPRFVLGTCGDKLLQGSLPCLCCSWFGACMPSFVDPGWIHNSPKHGGAREHVKKEEEKGFAFCLLLKDWEGKWHREPGGKCILKGGKANNAKWTKASRPRALWISDQPPPVGSQWPPDSSKAAIWGLPRQCQNVSWIHLIVGAGPISCQWGLRLKQYFPICAAIIVY